MCIHSRYIRYNVSSVQLSKKKKKKTRRTINYRCPEIAVFYTTISAMTIFTWWPWRLLNHNISLIYYTAFGSFRFIRYIQVLLDIIVYFSQIILTILPPYVPQHETATQNQIDEQMKKKGKGRWKKIRLRLLKFVGTALITYYKYLNFFQQNNAFFIFLTL